MNNHLFGAATAWENPLYRKTVMIVLCAIFVGAAISFLLRKKAQYFMISWASIKSWLIFAPLMFIFMGLQAPIPLIFLALLAIYGAKSYFQILGMYHQTYFVYICYLGIAGLCLSSMANNLTFYNEMPMAVLGLSCLVPLFKREYRDMIQYISLTLLGFIFLGWSFLHLGLIYNFENGLYQVMYLIFLTEFCDNTNLAISRYFRGPKIISEINAKRSWASTLVSVALTILVAYGMRYLLQNGAENYWLTTGVIASLGGVVGDMVMNVVRRDAGVKVVSGFILGRGDFLHRMDRLIFVAPIYYFVMLGLNR